MVKNPPAMWETWVQSLSWEDPLEKGTATHTSILAWRIPWTEEPGRLYSPWGCKESHMTELLSTAQHKVFFKTVMQYGSSDWQIYFKNIFTAYIYIQYIYIYIYTHTHTHTHTHTLSYILHLPALAGGFFTTSTTWEAPLKGKKEKSRK